jgi:SET domain-containing protein
MVSQASRYWRGALFSSDGRLLPVAELGRWDLPVFECGSECSCDDACTFRVVGRALRTDAASSLTTLQVFDTGCARGRGLRCTTPLPAGTVVGVYAGEAIDEREAERRWAAEATSGTGTFILCVREVFADHTVVTCVDARNAACVLRYVNHRCDDANLVVVCVRIDADSPHLCFVACRDVPALEELTLDYCPDARVSSSSSTVCLCGSATCRGFLPSAAAP